MKLDMEQDESMKKELHIVCDRCISHKPYYYAVILADECLISLRE